MSKIYFVIGILHWIFYGVFILPVIINAETWFFGIKLSGGTALIAHLLIGIPGIVLGYFIYKKYKYALWASLGLFVLIISSIIGNRLLV